MKWQPLNHPNDLLDHALFIVEIKPKAFTHLAPFYGIVKLHDREGRDGDLSVDARLVDAYGDSISYAVGDVSRWMPFDPKDYE